MRKKCLGCEDKKPGCHDRCPKYIGEWLADGERKSEVYQNRKKESFSVGLQVDSIRRYKKRTGQK